MQGWTETSRSSHGGHRAPHSVSSARPTAEAPPGAAGRGFGQPPGGGRRRQVAGPGGTRAYPGQRADQDAWIMTPECQEGLRALAGGSGTDLLHKGIANFIPNCQAQGPFPKVPSLATLTSGSFLCELSQRPPAFPGNRCHIRTSHGCKRGTQNDVLFSRTEPGVPCLRPRRPGHLTFPGGQSRKVRRSKTTLLRARFCAKQLLKSTGFVLLPQ